MTLGPNSQFSTKASAWLVVLNTFSDPTLVALIVNAELASLAAPLVFRATYITSMGAPAAMDKLAAEIISTRLVLVVVASIVLPPSLVMAPLPPAGAAQLPSSFKKLPALAPFGTRPWALVEKSKSMLSSGAARSSILMASAPPLAWAAVCAWA